MNYIYHGIMNTDYNRRQDVSLGHICDCTPYCTYQCGMDDPQYVHADVPSDYFTESFITHITAKWMLPSMYTLMYLQMFLYLESFITHITAIWTLPSVYTLM
jgi:hypothetical protein